VTKVSAASNLSEIAKNKLVGLISGLTSSNPDLANCVRDCLAFATLLQWSDDEAWFQSELNGYGKDDVLPGYRVDVPVHTDKRPMGKRELITYMVENDFRKRASDSQSFKMNVPWPVDQLLARAVVGFYIDTGKTTKEWSTVDEREIELHLVVVHEKSDLLLVVSRLQTALLSWCSQSLRAIEFGDSAADIFGEYRALADQLAVKAGIAGHLEAINRGLASSEQQEWRQTMWSTRDVLHDLAKFLWQDSRSEYEPIKNDQNKLMKVTDSDYVNRLAAYLHQKRVSKSSTQYLEAELARLHTLNDVASKAHDKVTYDDARLCAMGLYGVLGEIAYRTDSEPVTEYVNIEEGD